MSKIFNFFEKIGDNLFTAIISFIFYVLCVSIYIYVIIKMYIDFELFFPIKEANDWLIIKYLGFACSVAPLVVDGISFVKKLIEEDYVEVNIQSIIFSIIIIIGIVQLKKQISIYYEDFKNSGFFVRIVMAYVLLLHPIFFIGLIDLAFMILKFFMHCEEGFWNAASSIPVLLQIVTQIITFIRVKCFDCIMISFEIYFPLIMTIFSTIAAIIEIKED